MKNIIKKLLRLYNRLKYGTIVMAHHVYNENNNDKNGITIKEFKSFIEKNKKNIISTRELLKAKIKANKIALTIDDGYDDVYKTIFPICLAYNIPFTIFIIIDKINEEGFLSSKEIVEMLNSGLVTLGSHGLSHVILTNSNVDLEKEISFSKQYLENLFNIPIEYFAFSHGQFNKKIVKLVYSANYKKSFGASFFSSSRNVAPRINITHLCRNESFIK